MVGRQSKPVVEVVLTRGARLAANALGHARGSEGEDGRADRLLERSVAARQLRADRATVLGVACHRGAVQQNRGSVVAAVAGTGPHRGVKDDELIAHYALAGDEATILIAIRQLAACARVSMPRLCRLVV